MPQIFHRSANSLANVSIVAALLAFGGILGRVSHGSGRVHYRRRCGPRTTRPFSHKHHVSDAIVLCHHDDLCGVRCGAVRQCDLVSRGRDRSSVIDISNHKVAAVRPAFSMCGRWRRVRQALEFGLSLRSRDAYRLSGRGFLNPEAPEGFGTRATTRRYGARAPRTPPSRRRACTWPRAVSHYRGHGWAPLQDAQRSKCQL